MKNVGYFALGAILGGLGVYLAMYYKYEKNAVEEDILKEVREAYMKDLDKKLEDETIEKAEAAVNDIPQNVDVNSVERGREAAKEDGEYQRYSSLYSGGEVTKQENLEKEEVMESIMDKRIPSPYLITPTQFSYEERGFDKIPLHYFPETHELLTEEGEAVDISATVGSIDLNELEFDTEPIYVRDETAETDYEIYADEE